jgi:hypothetical protein
MLLPNSTLPRVEIMTNGSIRTREPIEILVQSTITAVLWMSTSSPFNDACRTFEPMVADMETARHELAAARDELVAARDRLSSECAGLRSERDSLVAAHNGQLTTQGGFVREYDKLKAERDAFAIDNAKMLAERHAMLASTSWRVTAPLRSFRRLLSQSTRLFDRTGRASGR